MSLESGLQSLKRGEFVLLFDSAGRENEIDMVVAAEYVTPEHVARMRQNAGGLLCIAIDHEFGNSLGLRYMHDILAESSTDKEMIMGLAPYGDRPTFSISVNHYQTYTGITDKDRSLTITEMAKIFDVENRKKKFVSSFKTPGHVPLLLASKGLLENRQGHTEMSIYLTKLAELTPVTAICEMMDAETYTALSVDKAEKFAKQNGIPLIDGKELLEYAKVN
ncbi:MAG TPA: 3,4-dihydroxy-2-butanone-4-phosphate synthase [Nitrosopumilaceae archaeon]|nr:3,4-dihydroxy-2-butanone-4-phosphate synthase [Nitrosopumilaceae archaeon]